MSTTATAASHKSQQQAQRIDRVGDFILERTCGQGQFGKVKLAVHSKTGLKVAIKMIYKPNLTPDTLRMVQREVRIMKMLHHPNIVQLYEVIETDSYMFLIMEYAAGGEVMDLIMAHGRLKEREARRFFTQTAEALRYCHARHTVHRDIKAENLLLDSNMNIKLIDFGLSNVFTPGSLLKTFCGSPTYASPELVQRREYAGPEVDCWSLGVLLYVLVCGELPFDGATFLELYRKIIDARYRLPAYLSPLCRDLIQRMLVPDPRRRANIDQILAHPWVTEQGSPMESLSSPPSEFSPEVIHSPEDLDPSVLSEMVEKMGYTAEQVIKSVCNDLYDDVSATYFLIRSQRQNRTPSARPSPSSSPVPGSTSMLAESQPSSPQKQPAIVAHPAATAAAVAMANGDGIRRPQPMSAEKPKKKSWTLRKPSKKEIEAEAAAEQARATSGESKMPQHSQSPSIPSIPIPPLPRASIDVPRPEAVTLLRKEKEAREQLKMQKALEKARTKDVKIRARRGSNAPPPVPAKPDEDDWVIVEAEPLRDLPSSEAMKYDELARKVNREYKKPTMHDMWVSMIGSTTPREGEKAEEEPRTLRFAFNVQMTSTKDAKVLSDDIKKVLDSAMPPITYSIETPYLLKCTDRRMNVAFEIEICRLPQLSVNGVRFHRLRGDSWRYKSLCKELLSRFDL